MKKTDQPQSTHPPTPSPATSASAPPPAPAPVPSTTPGAVRGSIVVGIYARYSCDKQDDTSLEDQIRRCREAALRLGLIVDEQHIYTDSALSGLDDERPGYRRLLAAWFSGALQVVLVDEPRLSISRYPALE